MISLIIFRYIIQLEYVESTTHHLAIVTRMFNPSCKVTGFDEFWLTFYCDFQMEIVFCFSPIS